MILTAKLSLPSSSSSSSSSSSRSSSTTSISSSSSSSSNSSSSSSSSSSSRRNSSSSRTVVVVDLAIKTLSLPSNTTGVLEHIFGELTVLGFLGMITYLMISATKLSLPPLGLYKIMFHFCVCVQESIIHLLPAPIRTTSTTAILLRDFVYIYIYIKRHI